MIEVVLRRNDAFVVNVRTFLSCLLVSILILVWVKILYIEEGFFSATLKFLSSLNIPHLEYLEANDLTNSVEYLDSECYNISYVRLPTTPLLI